MFHNLHNHWSSNQLLSLVEGGAEGPAPRNFCSQSDINIQTIYFISIFLYQRHKKHLTLKHSLSLLLQATCMVKSPVRVSSDFLLPLIINSHHIGVYIMCAYWPYVLCQASFYKVKTQPVKNHHFCPHWVYHEAVEANTEDTHDKQ